MSEARKYPGTTPEERTYFQPYSAFDIPADLRELHGRYDVAATAQRVRNFRYAEEWIMRTLGGWIATIPELPVKTGLGKITWEIAKIADELGKRLPELRAGRSLMTASQPANERFAECIRRIAEPDDPDHTIEKLTGVFDVLIEHLIQVYARTASETDQIADAPTVELLHEAVRTHERHRGWGKEVLDRLCEHTGAAERRRRRSAQLESMVRESGGVCGDLS